MKNELNLDLWKDFAGLHLAMRGGENNNSILSRRDSTRKLIKDKPYVLRSHRLFLKIYFGNENRKEELKNDRLLMKGEKEKNESKNVGNPTKETVSAD